MLKPKKLPEKIRIVNRDETRERWERYMITVSDKINELIDYLKSYEKKKK